MWKTIVDAAEDLFDTYGFANVSIDEIAAVVGTTAPHVRQYFSSTEALLFCRLESFTTDCRIDVATKRLYPHQLVRDDAMIGSSASASDGM